MHLDFILQKLEGKRVIILGYGREGSSSYHFIRRYFPTMDITVSDKSETLSREDFLGDEHLTLITGKQYDRNLNDYDLILKSPGISFSKLDYLVETERITSQTDLFLQAFHAHFVRDGREQAVGETADTGRG